MRESHIKVLGDRGGLKHIKWLKLMMLAEDVSGDQENDDGLCPPLVLLSVLCLED